jgi:hypothetical protein
MNGKQSIKHHPATELKLIFIEEDDRTFTTII